MRLGELTTIAWAAVIAASWAMAQEDEKNSSAVDKHMASEWALEDSNWTMILNEPVIQQVEEASCEVWRLVQDLPFCISWDYGSQVITDFNGNEISSIWSENDLRQVNGYTIIKDYNETNTVVIDNATWESFSFNLPKYSSVEWVKWGKVLINNNGYNLYDLSWNMLFWNDDIIISTEDQYVWYKWSEDMDNDTLNMVFANFINDYQVYLPWVDTSIPEWTSLYNDNRNDIVKFLWNNRENIKMRMSELDISDFVRFVNIWRDNFDTIEEIVGRVEWTRILTWKWYNDFVEYYDILKKEWIVEAFGYWNIQSDSPFWEDLTPQAEQDRIAKSILAMFRRLDEPATRFMIDFIFPESETE